MICSILLFHFIIKITGSITFVIKEMTAKLIDICLMFFLINLKENFTLVLISMIQECTLLASKVRKCLHIIVYLNGSKKKKNMNKLMTNMDQIGLVSNHLILILLVQVTIWSKYKFNGLKTLSKTIQSPSIQKKSLLFMNA
jgi:hypothetical protein